MALIVKPNTFSSGAVITASEHNENDDTIYNDYNGNITNVNISGSAAIANTKLAAPNSFFTIALTADGQFTSTVDPLRTFQMPFGATLTEVSAVARDIDTADANETYTVDIEDDGTTVLSSAIALTADNTAVVGTIASATIADNSKMELVLTLGGTSPALDDLTVLLTFKVANTS